jgi:hypothetical protein
VSEAVDPGPTGVFLSYSQNDTSRVAQLRNALGALGVSIRIDTESMVPGQPIRSFILDSIRRTEATLWVVSEASLVSGWVANEIALTLHDLELWNKRKLVACYLDDEFLSPDFRLSATDKIDARLAQIDALMPRYRDKHIDTNDLNAEKSRLHELRTNLGILLDRIKNSLCVDIRGSSFDTGVQALASALCPALSRAGTVALSAASDIEKRRDEIYSLIGSSEASRALIRLMDFVRDFSDHKQHLKAVVVIKSNYSLLESIENASLKEKIEERKALLHEALDLLENVVETLAGKAA